MGCLWVDEMENAKDVTISVCPNCGRVLRGPEFLTSVDVMPQQVGIAFDPIAGRFLCPDCNYTGLPVSVKAEDHAKMKFERKTIASPLTRSNPFFWQLVLVSMALLLLSIILENLVTGTLTAVAGFAILAYAMLKVQKYRKSNDK
jgi:hypothetical protein